MRADEAAFLTERPQGCLCNLQSRWPKCRPDSDEDLHRPDGLAERYVSCIVIAVGSVVAI